MNLLDNTATWSSKFRARKWVQIIDQSKGEYSTGSQIKFKTAMVGLSLCDYSDAYILLKGFITVFGQGSDVAAVATDINNKQVVFKNCAQFISCISETNNT